MIESKTVVSDQPTPAPTPDQPPNQQEEQYLRAWLQYTQSMYNRLTEINSPWAAVVQQVGEFIDDILAPDDGA